MAAQRIVSALQQMAFPVAAKGYAAAVSRRIAEHLQIESAAPVLFLPRGPGREAGPVLIPLDGSRAAAAAIEPGMKAACALSAEIVMLYVVPPLNGGASLLSQFTLAEVEAALVGDALPALSRSGVPYRVRIGTGLPVEEILAAVERESAALIAMSTRGRNAAAGSPLGQVAEEILSKTSVPLLLVPGAAQ